MGVFLTSAVPPCFDLHAIRDSSALDPEQGGQSEFRYESVSRPMDFLPMINPARRHWYVNGNLRGQLLIGIARQPDLRRPKFHAQVSLLQINGFYCFGEKEIDGHSRIRLSNDLGQVLLHGFGGQEPWIAEF